MFLERSGKCFPTEIVWYFIKISVFMDLTDDCNTITLCQNPIEMTRMPCVLKLSESNLERTVS